MICGSLPHIGEAAPITPPRKPITSYRKFKQFGQAVATIYTPDGTRRDVLLGPSGSPESRAEYERVIAELRGLPVRVAATEGIAPPADISVNEVILAVIGHDDPRYRRRSVAGSNRRAR